MTHEGLRKTGLVLQRRPGESIIIPTESGLIEITVIDNGNRGRKIVRLLFSCPESVKIFRKEKYEELLTMESPSI